MRNSTGNGVYGPNTSCVTRTIGFRREPFRYRVAQTMLQGLARLGIGCQHDDLGEGRIGQFRRHGEEEARSALSDIARDDLCLG